MSNLPDTLEKMQRDILQYDLSNNPYLQHSSIPFKDKELKTKSKKIIPAINELLNIITTFSNGIETYMKNTEDEIKDLKNDMSLINENIKKLTHSYESIEEKVNDLSKKYDDCIKKAAEIELDIDTIKKVCKCYNTTIMEVNEVSIKGKFKIKAGAVQTTTIPAEELYDPDKQIKKYVYDEGDKKYKYIPNEFIKDQNNDSAYKFNIRPLEIQIEDEDSNITLVNRSNLDLIVFILN